MYNSSLRSPVFLVLIALLVIPISGLAVDIYAPSLPAVSDYFNVDKSLAQISITSYMAGIGLMQLFAGMISDSFGRRKPFLVATFIFIIATLIIPISQSIYQLIFLRFIQGVAVAQTVVSMRSVIPDLFEGKALYKWMNYMVMAWSIGPIIAPAIGGYLQHYFGWKSNFYFLASYTILTGLLVYFYLPETSKQRHSFHLSEILKRYVLILSNREYLFALLTNGLLYSSVILFTVVGPFLVQSVMHYSAITFGYVALLMGAFWFIGALTNRFLIHIDLKLKTKVCLSFMFLISMINLVLTYHIDMNIYSVVIPVLLISLFGGIIFPNNFARGVSLFPTMTGSANALFGGGIFILTSTTSALATYLKSAHLTSLATAYVGLIFLCIIIARLRK